MVVTINGDYRQVAVIYRWSIAQAELSGIGMVEVLTWKTVLATVWTSLV